MKKILISIGVLLTMSFTTSTITNYQLAVALDNIGELQEWMKEDMAHNAISPKLGVYYLEKLEETEALIIDFKCSVRNPSKEELEERIEKYTN